MRVANTRSEKVWVCRFICSEGRSTAHGNSERYGCPDSSDQRRGLRPQNVPGYGGDVDVQVHLFRGTGCGRRPYLATEMWRCGCRDAAVQRRGLRPQAVSGYGDLDVQIDLFRLIYDLLPLSDQTTEMRMSRSICSEVRSAAASRTWLRRSGCPD